MKKGIPDNIKDPANFGLNQTCWDFKVERCVQTRTVKRQELVLLLRR